MNKKKYDFIHKKLKKRKTHSLDQYLSWCRQKGVADSLDSITTWTRHKGLLEPLNEEATDEEFEKDEGMDLIENSDEEDSDVLYIKTVKTGIQYVKIEPADGGEPYLKRAANVILDNLSSKRPDSDDEKQAEMP